MPHTIKKETGFDVEYYGYHTRYVIDFVFTVQKATVSIEIWPDKEEGVYHLDSETDGYHWLHYFLSQEPMADELMEWDYNETELKCKEAFAPHGIIYRQEDKETAWITRPIALLTEEMFIKAVAGIIEPRFANREKFFPKNN